jgi:hypothetical protein
MDLAVAAGVGVPLMVRFRYHGGHRATGAEHTQSRDNLHTTKQQPPSSFDRPEYRSRQAA